MGGSSWPRTRGRAVTGRASRPTGLGSTGWVCEGHTHLRSGGLNSDWVGVHYRGIARGLRTWRVGVPVPRFIPTVGAVFSGGVVVLVALVSEGTTTALILAAVVLVVQQLDANVMYPMLASRHLSLHPLASLLLVAAGGVVGGLFGAFIAVPAAAVLLAAARELLSDGEEVPLLVEIVAPVDPDGVDVSAKETSSARAVRDLERLVAVSGHG